MFLFMGIAPPSLWQQYAAPGRESRLPDSPCNVQPNFPTTVMFMRSDSQLTTLWRDSSDANSLLPCQFG